MINAWVETHGQGMLTGRVSIRPKLTLPPSLYLQKSEKGQEGDTIISKLCQFPTDNKSAVTNSLFYIFIYDDFEGLYRRYMRFPFIWQTIPKCCPIIAEAHFTEFLT